jgi:hypothetical protein
LKIKAAIDSLSSAITADPAKARGKNLPATARLVEGLKCELRGPYGWSNGPRRTRPSAVR